MSSNNFWLKLAQDLGFNKEEKILKISKDPNKDSSPNRVHVPVLKLNVQQQADVLYLPADKNGFKYVLVVADYNRKIGAYPLKTLNGEEIVKAFKEIYKNDGLTPPAIIQFDNGPEFKNKNVVDYFKSKNSSIKYTKPYRSRQNGLVENINFIIGKLVGVYQNKGMLKNKQFKWVDLLPDIVRVYNKSQENIKPPDKMEYPKCKGDACELLKVDDKVRIPLEHPVHPKTGEPYPTKKFRSNDIRYDPKVYEIENVILKPNTPPLYMVNQKDRVAYTKKQIEPLNNEVESESEDEEEELPDGVYKIEKFLNKRKQKGKVQFLVKYQGFEEEKDQLWQDRTFLISELGTDQFKELERDFKK